MKRTRTTSSKAGARVEGAESPVRWTAGKSDDDLEARAGLLLRQAIERRPLDDSELAAIRERVVEGPSRRVGSRVLIWQVAFSLAVLLSGGALVAGATHLLRRTPGVEVPRPSSDSAPAPVRSARRHARASNPPSLEAPSTPAPALEAAPAAHPAPLDSPADESVSTLSPAKAASARSRREPLPRYGAAAGAPAAPLPPSALAREAHLLAEVLHKLRQEDDPTSALALLDQHGVGFSGAGALATEADAARIEALLRLRRNDQALALLDAKTLAPGGADREPLVARGELRALSNRCAEAAADFDLLLARPVRPGGDAVTERALYGRASCRARRRDAAGARADLTEYLARFPQGRFAAAARAALAPGDAETSKP